MALAEQSQAAFQAAVLRGRCFVGGTAASGVAPATAIGTTAAFTIYNPKGSGVNLVLWKATCGYLSGTLGAGTVHWVANTDASAAVVTGTAITAVNCLVGSGYAAQGKPLTTATLPATPTIMRPAFSLGASLATTAAAPWQVIDHVNGEIVVPPGMAVSLEGTTAAGTTPLVLYGLVWEEAPL